MGQKQFVPFSRSSPRKSKFCLLGTIISWNMGLHSLRGNIHATIPGQTPSSIPAFQEWSPTQGILAHLWGKHCSHSGASCLTWTQCMYLSRRMDDVVFVKRVFEISRILGTKLERTVKIIGGVSHSIDYKENYKTYCFNSFKCTLGVTEASTFKQCGRLFVQSWPWVWQLDSSSSHGLKIINKIKTKDIPMISK